MWPPPAATSNSPVGRLAARRRHRRIDPGRRSIHPPASSFPNGAVRSPDAAWAAHSRLAPIAAEWGRKFLPLCPDFVVEIASPSNSVPALQRKMEEYRDNGARLGWLILPDRRQLLVYHADGAVEHLAHPSAVAGDPVLPGFVLATHPHLGIPVQYLIRRGRVPNHLRRSRPIPDDVVDPAQISSKMVDNTFVDSDLVDSRRHR